MAYCQHSWAFDAYFWIHFKSGNMLRETIAEGLVNSSTVLDEEPFKELASLKISLKTLGKEWKTVDI